MNLFSKDNFKSPPTNRDSLFLIFFTIFITFQPFYLHKEFNIFEYGIYLPGIDAISRGLVPFRDFFHLRGAFELYLPAFFMNIFGMKVSVLSLYFYIGNVLALILCVLIAKEILKSKLIFYLSVPVLIAKTFPRVVFTYWGGMRYAFGLLVLFSAIKFFKSKKYFWLVFSGIFAAVGFFTSIEIGVLSTISVLGALAFSCIFKVQNIKEAARGLGNFISGALIISIPYLIYLIQTQSLTPYVESFFTVAISITGVFETASCPSSMKELFYWFMPTSPHFKHITPAFLYFALFIYLAKKAYDKDISRQEISIVVVAIYGVLMFISAFRAVEGDQFEMALQPEKILLFYAFGESLLFINNRFDKGRLKIVASSILVFFVLFSCIYSFKRYFKRFDFPKFLIGKYQAKPNCRKLNVERAGNLVASKFQAKEVEQLVDVIQQETNKEDTIFSFPEMGTYLFLADRQFFGKFPMYTFSWFSDNWHNDLIADINENEPEYVVMPIKLHRKFEQIYFKVAKNRDKYNIIINIITKNYYIASRTEEFYFFKRR
ncbi:MAG: hypothetical protein P9X22_01200 [Candidatus Zapsychrus exili]|nr:hypothetical protein [Candidatus Zapsychrus exili]